MEAITEPRALAFVDVNFKYVCPTTFVCMMLFRNAHLSQNPPPLFAFSLLVLSSFVRKISGKYNGRERF